MSRLTVRLPETLHRQLASLAKREGVSVNQYVVYALTRQAASADAVQAASGAESHQQRQDFEALRKELGNASPTALKAVLDKRETVQPEAELSLETVTRFQQRLREASNEK